MDFLKLAHERYSCRKFSGKVVEQEQIDKIIEAGLAAPTAVNFQPFKIWVVRTQENLEKISEATPFRFGASTVFIIGADTKNAYVRRFDAKNFGEIDACIVTTHMMLAVHDLGLGTTWVGAFDESKLKSLLPETKDYDIVALLPVGYPADDVSPSEKHYSRKSASEIVKYI
ncbi:MAG: nitroreductase family protein [Candidatus Gastranaerophilaceae bacterium]|nr:nitroreductase family protein [Candidatus Gastranaerophilaceae bacterium]